MAAPISPITTDGSVDYGPNTMLGSSLSLKDGRESTIWRFTEAGRDDPRHPCSSGGQEEDRVAEVQRIMGVD